jgi:ribose/xylose/arabinose/galactoside ABC-type transport system permease subunit
MSDKINIKLGVTRISLIGLVYGAIVGIISFFIQVYFKFTDRIVTIACVSLLSGILFVFTLSFVANRINKKSGK